MSILKKRIMIIEDDLELLSILHDLFERKGFDVVVYPDKNSIKGVIINRPDVVLLDERLRDGLGHELCAEIKEHELTKHIVVILASGRSGLREIAAQCRADDYIEKPFDLDELVAMVTKHLQTELDHDQHPG